jgi:hypothetical protein
MQLAPLTFKSITARAVVLKLKRPVVARIATITDWPLILIDLITEEGIVGRSYLEPYTIKTMRYLIPALQDFGAMLKGVAAASLPPYPRSGFRIRPRRASPPASSRNRRAGWSDSSKAPDFKKYSAGRRARHFCTPAYKNNR